MNTFAEALQAIEVQSETLREIIEERWASEKEWRRLLRVQLFKALPSWLDQEVASDEGRALREQIEENISALKNLDDNSNILQEFAGRIDALCENSLREGYMIEAFLAVVQEGVGARARAVRRILDWSEIAEREHVAGRAKAYDVWSAPLFLYACGELQLAIDVGEKLLSSSQLQNFDREVLAFNLANHIIEDAYFALPEASSPKLTRVKELIASASTLRTRDESAFLDAEGMCDVAFSQEAGTLRAAIDKIHAGNTNVLEGEEAVAQAYYELHMRLAWRRLLEIETMQARTKS